MSRRRGCPECCGHGCAVDEDDFDRAPSTKLGPKWTEDPDHATWGQWRIFDNKLQESGADALTGTPGALVITTAEADQKYMGVRAHRINSGAGVIHRWHGNIVDTVDGDCVFAETEDIGGLTTVRLYRRENGVDELLVEKVRAWVDTDPDAYDPAVPGICLSPSSFTFFGPPGPAVWHCVDNPATFYHRGGYKAGLGNGGSEVVEFDNFDLKNRLDTITPLVCCGQQCQCGSEPDVVCLPDEPEFLILQFYVPNDDEDNDCYDMAHESQINPIELHKPISGGRVWEAEGTGTGEGWDVIPGGVDWVFECAFSHCGEDFSEDQFSLRIRPPGEICTYPVNEQCLYYYEGAVSVTCEPFLVVFRLVGVPPIPGPPGGCAHCLAEGGGAGTGSWWAEVSWPT